MPTVQTIYGLECSIPDQPPISKIDGNKLAVKKQKFRRVEWEKELEDVEYDAEEKPVYNEKHLKFIDREFDRCTNGFWFMNKGVPTYLTPKAYYYYSYWVLENGVRPEFRESDRLFFLFFETCLKHPQIKGLIRIKNRRLGATSIGTCISVHIATFNSNKRCGNVSKKDTDAEKMFQDMIVKGFYSLPEFLRPRVDTSSTSKKKLHFIETPKKGKGAAGRVISGLNSLIDFEPTTMGSYDSTRLSYAVIDEGGKWEKINVNSYYNDVVKECVSEGARKKGFLYMPSTVNAPDKGGANFKILWDDSDHLKMGIGNTATDMVRFFMPSYLCMAGFFDEYGHSVVDPPDDETLKFLIKAQENEPEEERIAPEDLAKGAKKFLEDALSKLTDQDRIDAFKRKYPLTETDSFSWGSTSSPFNTTKIQEQINWLDNNPMPLRRGNLYMDFDKKVHFADDAKGKWLIYKPPSNPNDISIDEEKKVVSPNNWHLAIGGVDTFKFDKTISLGSQGVICIGSQFNQSDPDTGEIQAMYEGRPPLTELFWREMLYAAVWYGCKLVVENDATREYEKYFRNTMKNVFDMNCVSFLHRTPNVVIDTSKKVHANKRFDIGVASRDPFAFNTEISVAQTYIEKYIDKIYFPLLLNELMTFNVDDRTKSDKTIGFMMYLIGLTGETKARKAEAKKEPMVMTYRIGY